MKAPPGTELFERIKREDRLSKQFAFSEGDTNIVPVMDEKILFDGFIDLISDIYLPEKSYQRLIQFFKNYHHPKTNVKINIKYGLKDIGLVFRIFYLLGVKDKNRKFFWNLILWTLKNNRKFLDKAIFYGIMIYQMHQTYQHIRKTVESREMEVNVQKDESALRELQSA